MTTNDTSARAAYDLGVIGASASVPLGDNVPEVVRGAFQEFVDARTAYETAREKRWTLAGATNDQQAEDQDRQDLLDATRANRKPTPGKHVAALRAAREQAAVVEEACLLNLGDRYLAAVELARTHRSDGMAHALGVVDDRRRQLDLALARLVAAEVAWHEGLRLVMAWQTVPTDDIRSPMEFDSDPATGPVRFDNTTVGRPNVPHLLAPVRDEVEQVHALLNARQDAALPGVLPTGTTSLAGVRWER